MSEIKDIPDGADEIFCYNCEGSPSITMYYGHEKVVCPYCTIELLYGVTYTKCSSCKKVDIFTSLEKDRLAVHLLEEDECDKHKGILLKHDPLELRDKMKEYIEIKIKDLNIAQDALIDLDPSIQWVLTNRFKQI